MKKGRPNLIKFAVGLLISALAAVEGAMTLRNPKADLIEHTKSGTMTYRPDGEDSTLLCMSEFASLHGEKHAYRIFDESGQDTYPENFGKTIQVGQQLKLEDCKTTDEGSMSRDQWIACVDAIARGGATAKIGIDHKLYAEQVDYHDECEGPAKPKNVKLRNQNTAKWDDRRTDYENISKLGTVLYRPDGKDSTLFCFKNFKSSTPRAFRVYDTSGKDDLSTLHENITSIGTREKIGDCKLDKDGGIKKDQVMRCLAGLSKKGSVVNGNMRVAEEVDFRDECLDSPKPRDVSQNATVTIPPTPEMPGMFYRLG